jgi:hypothetical protein
MSTSTHHTSPDRLANAVAERQHGIVTLAQLRELGVPARFHEQRLRQGRWRHVAPGVYRIAGAPVTWESELTAALGWLGPRAAVSHRAGAAIHHLDGFDPGPVELTVPRPRRSVQGPWTVHTTSHLPPTDVWTVGPFRVTSPTRTLIDLAGADIPPKPLGAAIDDAVRQHLTSVAHLTRRFRALRSRGRAGSSVLAGLLLDSGGHSVLERAFLRLMRTHGIPLPSCQVVHRADGRTAARVDFEWTPARVVAEVSGRFGHTSDRDRERTARRLNHLQIREGLVVIEFTTTMVLGDPDYVVDTVRTAIGLTS